MNGGFTAYVATTILLAAFLTKASMMTMLASLTFCPDPSIANQNLATHFSWPKWTSSRTWLLGCMLFAQSGQIIDWLADQ